MRDLLTVAAGLAGFFYLPGHCLVVAAVRRRRHALALDEGVLLAITLSLLLTTGLAHALATVGLFSLRNLALLVGVFAAPCAVAALIGRWSLWPFRVHPAAALTLGTVAVAVAMYLPPDRFLFGGADEGTYFSAGAAVAREGGLSFVDPLLGSLPAQLRELHSTTYLPGFYFDDLESRGPVIPHGFHFYVAFLAVWHALGGMDLAAGGAVFAAALTVLGAALLLRRLAGPAAAALVGVLVAVNPFTVWFARVTYVETFVAALATAACALTALAGPGRGRGTSWQRLCCLTGGMSLGAIHLAKFDFFYLPAALLAVVYLLWGRKQARWYWGGLLAGFSPFLGLAVAYAFGLHRPYLAGLLSHAASFLGLPPLRAHGVLLEPGMVLLTGGLAAFLLLGVVLVLFRRPLRRLLLWLRLRRADILLGAIVLAATGLLLFGLKHVRPDLAWPFIPWEHQTAEFRLWALVQRLAVPLAGLGLLVALPGLGLLLRWKLATPLLLAAVLGLVQLTVAAVAFLTTDWLSRFPHLGRRLFLVMPVLFGAALALFFARGLPWPRSRALAGLFLAGFLGFRSLETAAPHVGRRVWGRSPALLAELIRAAPPRTIWLAREDDGLAARWLVPLRFLAGRPTFLCRRDFGDAGDFGLLLQVLVDRGLEPVFLLGDALPAEVLQDGRLVYLPAVSVRRKPEPESPLWLVSADYGTRKLFGELVFHEDLLRFPDESAYDPWWYRLVLLRPW